MSGLSRRQFLQGAGGMAAAVSLGGLLSACGSSAKKTGGGSAATTATTTKSGGGATTNKTLRIAIGSYPQTFDIDKSVAGTNEYFTSNVYETLIGRNIAGQLEPRVAQSYTVSPDGKTFTFKLRPGVRFHDGTPVTAEDVKFSFERFIAPATGNGFAFDLAGLTGVDILSSDTVAIHLKAYDAGFLPSGGYAAIIPMNYVQQKGAAYFNEHPIGTGPWMFKSTTVNENFVLDRFDQYYGQQPGYSQAIFNILPQDSTRIAALQSGEVDLIAQVSPSELKSLATKSGIVVKQIADGDSVNIRINTLPSQAGKPWMNVKVRQALDYAINRDEIIQTIMFGGGTADTAIQPYDAAWPVALKMGLKPRPYDPAMAKSLLKEAGYGSGFSCKLIGLVDGRQPTSAENAQAIGGYWNAIGVNTDVQIVSYNSFVDAEQKTSPDAFVYGLFGDGTSGPSLRFNFAFKTGGLYSVTADPKLDALIQTAVTTVDQTQLQVNYVKVGQYIQDQAYEADLFALTGAFAMKDSVSWEPWFGQPATIMQNARPA